MAFNETLPLTEAQLTAAAVNDVLRQAPAGNVGHPRTGVRAVPEFRNGSDVFEYCLRWAREAAQQSPSVATDIIPRWYSPTAPLIGEVCGELAWTVVLTTSTQTIFEWERQRLYCRCATLALYELCLEDVVASGGYATVTLLDKAPSENDEKVLVQVLAGREYFAIFAPATLAAAYVVGDRLQINALEMVPRSR